MPRKSKRGARAKHAARRAELSAAKRTPKRTAAMNGGTIREDVRPTLWDSAHVQRNLAAMTPEACDQHRAHYGAPNGALSEGLRHSFPVSKDSEGTYRRGHVVGDGAWHGDPDSHGTRDESGNRRHYRPSGHRGAVAADFHPSAAMARNLHSKGF